MYEQAETLTREAGRIALDYFERLSSLPVESKGHLDLVTDADRAVEAFLIEGLHKAYPDDGIFGEEGGSHAGSSGRTWVVDPIDGTFNFVRGGDDWAVSVGLLEAQGPTFGLLYAPARNQFFAGGRDAPPTLNGKRLEKRHGFQRDRASSGVGFHPIIPVEKRLDVLRHLMETQRMTVRCCGSAAISLTEVALGQVDGYVGTGESSWDIVAVFAILEQLGIVHTVDWSDPDLQSKYQFAAGVPEFVRLLKDLIPAGARIDEAGYSVRRPDRILSAL